MDSTDGHSEALRRRLVRLGRRRPGAERVSLKGVPVGLGLPPGNEVPTPLGQAFLVESWYPEDYLHGSRPLSVLLRFQTTLVAELARRPSLADMSMQDLVFLDTETTGLAGGAGTLAFLVGLGRFHGGQFRLRQYFLRDPSEESAMLHTLETELAQAGGLVTFNGQTFDLPLLQMRAVVGLGRRWSHLDQPQLDMLHPARRLWKRELPNCSLSTLEQRILEVDRPEGDIAGELIPGTYVHYLRTGDTAGIARIFDHNAHDILSLVVLAARVLERHQQTNPSHLSGAEALALGRWHEAAGRLGSAEPAYRAAAASSDPGLRVDALCALSSHLKKVGKREQAVEVWKAWREQAPSDPQPCLDLAKYFEWHGNHVEEAFGWAQEALVCLSHWAPSWRREELWAEVEHRLARLARKTRQRPE
ncbi:MAG TPA: ribonuclease H-like domain-containing protein [Anaerolineales bacterium]|nr:ribonuclease H-like domain-containing protein [Anaerolineales bacterium]